MGLYEFRVQDAYDFANFVHAKVAERHGELFFQLCPYCHPKPTRDNLRSFSINLTTGQFKCLRASCGVSGNMLTLSKDFDFSLGSEVDEYYRSKRQFRRMKTPENPIQSKPEAIAYLVGRGISEAVIQHYQITVQTKHPNILVFPFFDEKGILQFVKYRKTDFDKAKDANKEWCEANTKPILFGMMQCVNFDRLILTEGQIDSLSVATAGFHNAVSVPTGAKGFTWIPYCWNWMNQFTEIVIFGDYEKGKISLLGELSKRMPTKIRHVREEDYQDCKDANEILQKYGVGQIQRCIEHAAALPVKQVIELADVEEVDLFQLEKLKTPLSQLNRLLYGGLPFGGLTILSGKPGDGKSTLASQILVSAIAQGYSCFAYSGELPNYLFRTWIDFQIAGPQHVYEYQNRYGDKNYSVSKTNRALIGEWYRGKFYLYDNASLDGEEKESLCHTVELVIQQYGVRVILLDNLMTALDLEAMPGSDKYERQSLFVKKLSRLALKYNVLILLVAHKRKNNYSTNENDEVSGSGDITNLALLTLSYERGKDLLDSQRVCKVSKNRLFGKVHLDGWVLNFQEKSKRIYGDGDDVNYEYGWNSQANGFGFLGEEEVSPFT